MLHARKKKPNALHLSAPPPFLSQKVPEGEISWHLARGKSLSGGPPRDLFPFSFSRSQGNSSPSFSGLRPLPRCTGSQAFPGAQGTSPVKAQSPGRMAWPIYPRAQCSKPLTSFSCRPGFGGFRGNCSSFCSAVVVVHVIDTAL